MIHLLVESRRFDDALSIMASLMSKLSPLQVLSGLVRSYEPCGSSPDVFDTLVRACTQNGDAEGACEVIEQVRAEGFNVSVHALNNFMGCLINLNEIDWFWSVYKEMGYVENVNTFNLVIYSFCKESHLLEALSVFYRMLKSGVWPNVVSFNMMIDGACKVGDMEFALELLGKMRVMSGGFVSPNDVTYNTVVNGFCKIGRLDLAERIRCEMVKSGVECNERTYGALVDAYGRCGRSDEALRLCDEMTSRGLKANTVVCNSVVYWLFMDGDVEGALLVLSDMISKEVEIDRFTHAIVIRGLCRNGYVEEAVKLQRRIKLEEDVVCYNTLMHQFVTERKMRCADQILGSMFVRGLSVDAVSFGTLIDGYLKKGKVEKAVDVYDGMVKMKKKLPNLVIYNSIVNGLSKRGLSNAAAAVVKAMESKDVVTYNTVLNESLKTGNVEEAVSVLSEMQKGEGEKKLVSLVTYNILINYLCKFGCCEKAKEVLKVMVERGVVPDSITYGTRITSFSKNRGGDEVVELHDYMVLNGVRPHEQIYKSIVSPLLDGET